MNSENQVIGCMPSYIDYKNHVCCGCVSEPARSVTPCTVPKFSPHPVQHHICSPQNCVIFGGHDYYPPVEICGRSRHKRNLNTLGSPIGLIKSSTPAKVEGQKGEMVRYATYLKAFAKIYLSPEIDWKTQTIDQLLKEGQTLLQVSKNYVPDELELTIYSDAEFKILREFELGGCTFQVELNEKYESFASEIEKYGDERTPELTVEFLRFALKGFFRNRKYCLLKLGNWYLLVWRVRGMYFVFDCNGRRLNDLNLDREKGVAVLICLKHLDNVCHLIQNLSGLNKNDAVSLRELKVVKLVDTDGKTMTREYGKRTNQYEIISPDYAILRTSLHLSLNRAEVVRHRSALPVAIAALLASKIDHPALWTQKVLDKIICFGVNVCRCCWSQCESAQEAVQVEMFPPQLKIGQFIADYRIWGRKIEGTWKCIPNYVHGEFSNAIEKCFDGNSNNLIIQIESQFYAVWKKNNFFYLMDPFRHLVARPPSTDDKSDDESEGRTGGKSASLRMFRTLDVLFQVFNQLLLESNKTSHFTIHTFKLRKLNLIEKQREGVPKGAAEAPPQELDEVKSLNEAVCFEEDEVKCLNELGEISDYEEENVSWMSFELTQHSSVSVPEEGLGEDEMGEEDFGDGFETDGEGEKKKCKGKDCKGKPGKCKGKDCKGKPEKCKGKKCKEKPAKCKGKDCKNGKPAKCKGKDCKDGKPPKCKGKDCKDGKPPKCKGKDCKDGKPPKCKGKDCKDEKPPKCKGKDCKDGKPPKCKGKDCKDGKPPKCKGKDCKDGKPAESTGKDGKPAESTGKDGKPAESTGKDGKHAESTGKDGKPTQSTGKDGTDGKTAESTGKDGKPAESTGKDGKPAESTGKDGKPAESTGKDGKPTEGTGKDGKPTESTGKDGKPAESTGKDGKDGKPTESTGKDGKPAESTGKDGEDGKPEESTGKDGKDGKPAESAGKDGEDGKPEESTGTDGKPAESTGKDGKPTESTGKDGKPAESTGKDGKPTESTGKDGKPTESTGKDGKPAESTDGKDGKSDTSSESHDEREGGRKPDKCHPNNYPGYSCVAHDMAVVGSDSGSYESICKLLRTSFKCADRILTMTPWGNYVVFRGLNVTEKSYFLFDGCTCNVNRFRHLDLTSGTAGLLCFHNLHDVISYILDSQTIRTNLKKSRKSIVDEICKQYCK